MKKRLLTAVVSMLLGATLALAQTGADKPKTELNPQPLPPGRHPETAPVKPSAKKGRHTGHKKLRKGSSGDAAANATTK